jgi:hypothetical protein
MKPNPHFVNQPKSFWAHVRTISQHVNYTERGTGQIKIPPLAEIQAAMEELELKTSHLVGDDGKATAFGQLLIDYFDFRAVTLNTKVASRLMNKERAQAAFKTLKAKCRPKCPIPMNKQKGDKKAPAFFTGIINMLIEANAEGLPCDYDPRELTTFTKDGMPLRTLARRIDGAFPRPINPIALWEIKEYYYTTTFGSRVADGVYESLLDGMELEELHEHEKIPVKHYLMVDDHFTWWECGRSYLCRIIDMLHMGYLNEVLFGSEVLDELPRIVKEWVALARQRKKGQSPRK